jgi:hypothetical protein
MIASAQERIDKQWNLSLLGSSILHTKIGKSAHHRVEKKFVRLKYLISTEKG